MSVYDCDECPMSLPDILSPRYCALGILEIDSCPHAAALKAVLENPELVLVAVPKQVEYLQGWVGEHSGPLWVWVKDESLWKKYLGSPDESGR